MTPTERRKVRTEVELMTTMELHQLAKRTVGTSATGELAFRVECARKVLDERRHIQQSKPRKPWTKK